MNGNQLNMTSSALGRSMCIRFNMNDGIGGSFWWAVRVFSSGIAGSL